MCNNAARVAVNKPPAAPTFKPVKAARRNLSWCPLARPLRAKTANVGRAKEVAPKMREGRMFGGLGGVSTSSCDVMDWARSSLMIDKSKKIGVRSDPNHEISV